MSEDLKVLIVDDTVTYRQIMSSIVSEMSGVQVLGVASNGKIALSKISLNQPDLVLLDVSMPEMDGLETLDRIKKEYPGTEVIMVSGMSRENAGLTVRALQSGALDFVPKPQGVSPQQSAGDLAAALAPLVSLARARKYSRQVRDVSGAQASYVPQVSRPEQPPREPPPVREVPKATAVSTRRNAIGKIEAVAVGVSTGGPNALQEIVPRIAAPLPVPILVVQHMPPLFTRSLAERLDKISEITVTEAQDVQDIEPGKMYIAPGGRHMVVRRENGRQFIGLTDSPPVNSCRPAVDVLFRSVAMTYGGNVLTVILTGMGNDGAAGVAAIRRKGGYSIVQDEKSCIVWGMPAAVAEANNADEIVPLARMAVRIMEIVKKGTR